MNLRELIDAYRDETGDIANPPLLSDALAIRYANRIEIDAARRSRLLVDSTSPSIAEAQVSIGEPLVDISPKIISIRRVRLQSCSVPLAKRTVRQMDEQFPGWDSRTNQSTPIIAVTDYSVNQLLLYPTPKADDTLLLTVTREPMKAMKLDDDKPELPERTHDALVSGIKYLAYTSDDVELYDATKAARALADFETEFGQKSSAMNERWEFEHYDDVGER